METTGISAAWRETNAYDYRLDFSFLPAGQYKATVCRDGINADRNAMDYVIENITIEPGRHAADCACRRICCQVDKRIRSYLGLDILAKAWETCNLEIQILDSLVSTDVRIPPHLTFLPMKSAGLIGVCEVKIFKTKNIAS